ncbi:ComF family protein [Lentilactobacillus kosonis]
MATRTVCTDCQKWIIRQDNFINTAIFAYDNSMQLFMKQYKFNGDYRLRLIFSAFMQAFINQRYKVENLVIVPVPVTETTLLQRGFNQVCGLLSEVKYMDCLTMKAISKVPQSMKTRQDRLLTPQPFELRPNLYKNLTGKNILIVDDIYTTGVTIRHAAKALSIVQPSKIMGLTLAR